MKKKLTKVQEMINYVYNHGPCSWTDIQMFITDFEGTPKELYKSNLRGYGSLGIWKCVRRPARGRHYFISNQDIYNNDCSKRYVVVDSRTMKTKWKR